MFSADSSGGAGGAIEDQGSVTILDSVFVGNSADAYGGAINAEFAQQTVDQITFTDKQAKGGGGGGGAIFAAGAVVVTRSLLSGNSAPADIGGAISDMTPGGVQLTDSTLTGNSSASFGGAIVGAHGVLC